MSNPPWSILSLSSRQPSKPTPRLSHYENSTFFTRSSIVRLNFLVSTTFVLRSKRRVVLNFCRFRLFAGPSDVVSFRLGLPALLRVFTSVSSSSRPYNVRDTTFKDSSSALNASSIRRSISSSMVLNRFSTISTCRSIRSDILTSASITARLTWTLGSGREKSNRSDDKSRT